MVTWDLLIHTQVIQRSHLRWDALLSSGYCWCQLSTLKARAASFTPAASHKISLSGLTLKQRKRKQLESLWAALWQETHLFRPPAAAAKSLQSCLTLCDPIDGSPPGSAIPGILQARTLEWVAISFSNAWKGKVKVKSLSCARLFATPWTAAHQAPLSMGFSRQEYWNGWPLPSPSDHLPSPRVFWGSTFSLLIVEVEKI